MNNTLVGDRTSGGVHVRGWYNHFKCIKKDVADLSQSRGTCTDNCKIKSQQKKKLPFKNTKCNSSKNKWPDNVIVNI